MLKFDRHKPAGHTEDGVNKWVFFRNFAWEHDTCMYMEILLKNLPKNHNCQINMQASLCR